MSEELPGRSRGTLFPDRLPTRFRRLPADGDARRLVSWLWVSQWDLPPGVTDRQHLLAFPACNLVVETTMVGLSGPTTRASHRDLDGTGWAVAALLRPAAAARLTDDPTAIRDDYVTVSADDLHSAVAGHMDRDDVEAAVAELDRWLVTTVGEPTEEALLANELAELIGTDPQVRTIADVADRLGVSQRTVHRLTGRYVGLTPYAMIRRRRLQEAAQQVREHPGVPLSDIAATHGFSDQAHLAREFRQALGVTPAAYRNAARADGDAAEHGVAGITAVPNRPDPRGPGVDHG